MSADDADDLALLRAYEPVVRYTQGELFFPTGVEGYLACCELRARKARGDSELVLGVGEVSVERLAEVGAARPGPGLFLRLVGTPSTRAELRRWRRRPGRPQFHGASRLSRVGVLSRVIDALMRVTLLFRGKVVRGTQAAAETLYRERMQPDVHPYYGRVVRTAGYLVLQYWIFYVFNDWRSRAYGVNDHEADWEQVTVYLAEQPDSAVEPAWVVFSAHDEVGDDLRRRWDDPDLARVGDHPVVHAGLGSHSGAYLPGEYLVSFDPPAFAALVRVFRSVTRALLPWTRGREQGGVGIPYVDYHRGDGVAIGPGEARSWVPVVVDDTTAWVVDYQGLWGNDTADPLGGERGPAGPRYERSGVVRSSWGDPVGWSGLAKVAPNAVVTEALVRSRLDELAGEVMQLDADLKARRTTLRADAATGVAEAAEREREVAVLAGRRVQLVDERRRLERRLHEPPPPAGPHDHLRHRALPSSPDTNVRRRFLAVWSAVSTPAVLVALALAFVPGRPLGVAAGFVVWLFLLLAVEAIARRHLTSFVVTLVALLGVLAVVSTLAGLTFYFGWQVTLAVVLVVAAAVLLVANLVELTRD